MSQRTGWSRQLSGTTLPLRGVALIGGVGGIAVGDSGVILRTTDGGKSWVRQSSGTSGPLYAVSFTDANTGTAVGGCFDLAGHTTILRTSDGGASWRQQPVSATSSLFGVHFTDASTGTAVGLWIALRTTDGGATWASQNPGMNWPRDVYFSDREHGTCVGVMTCRSHCSSRPAISRTTDGGASWSTFYSPGGSLYGVHFPDASTGTAVGMGGTILHTTTGGATWIQNPPAVTDEVPITTVLHQNFPNPFNPTTTISYQLPASGHVWLAVYDLLGREVTVLVNERQAAGSHRVTWEAGRSSSGVYFYRLIAGSYRETRKALYLR